MRIKNDMTYVLNCVLYLPTGHYDKINIFKGSPASAMCFQNILNELNLLPDDEVTKIAQFYFVILQPRYVLFVSVSLTQPCRVWNSTILPLLYMVCIPFFEQLPPFIRTDSHKKAAENMVDAFGALGTELSERLLAKKVILNHSPNPDLVKRVMTHVAIKDRAPFEVSCMR